MGLLAAGQVVLLDYPFSDLTRKKQRPAVILAEVARQDWIVCQITSNPKGDPLAQRITPADFIQGGLLHESYIRPGKLFTAHISLVDSVLGTLSPDAIARVRNAVVEIISKG